MKNIISAILIAIITILIVAPASAEPYADSLSGNGILNAAPTWLTIICYVVAGVISFCIGLAACQDKEDGFYGALFVTFGGTMVGAPVLIGLIMLIFFGIVL